MPKRKTTNDEDAAAEPLRRSTRQKTSVASVTEVPKEQRPQPTKPASTKVAKKAVPKKAAPLKQEAETEDSSKEKLKTPPQKKTTPASKSSKPDLKAETDEKTATTSHDTEERNYWLLKAEPETRLEKGIDVRFSIDDLAARKEPEPWDGIRAYAARNNLRAMKKGDLAFFYHSNCKEPGIVGTMEIVQEHSPDLTAHDPKAPYYDPNSKEDDPKWSVVHVVFRSKFPVEIGLKELKTLCAPGKPLENMQMLKQSRLSVSKVTADEWKFLNELAEKKAKEQKDS